MPQRISKGSLSLFTRRRGSARRIRKSSVAAAEHLESRTLLSTYYVSNGGNDSASGNSLSAPFRTIQRAANVAQPGDTVLVRAGTYRETVQPARSGTGSARITFKPYNNESVTISGADIVGGWSGHSGRIYKARQSWDLGFGKNQVFVDGQMMVEARWPNTSLNVSRPTKASIDSATVTLTDGTLRDAALTQPAGYWNGATIHMMPGQGWVGQTGTVTNHTTGALAISYAQMSSWEIPTAGDGYYLTGKFQALDAAGEWFRDPGTGQLYLWTDG